MARFTYKLPDIGEGIAEAEIVKWHAAEGQPIAENQPLVDIMTDKATVEIASPVSGTLVSCNGGVGDKLAVGAELALIETGVADAVASDESEVEPGNKDQPSHSAAPEPHREASTSRGVLAAAAVRGRAKALGLDLATIKGSGPDGRVLHADLDAVLTSRGGAPSKTPSHGYDGIEDLPVFGLRRRIAERMLEAKRQIPHFTYVEEIDVEALETMRAGLNAGGAAPALTILPFLIRAIVAAVKKHPAVNGHFDSEASVFRRYRAVHVGIAVQTERGLLVPVLRHAEAMSLREIAEGISRLADEARKGKSARDELSGSTITVTSLGKLGGLMATPIVNPPEVAIIGVNRITEAVVLEKGQLRTRRRMNLSSSFDHRIIDGAAAAEFIAAVKAELETPYRLAAAPAAD